MCLPVIFPPFFRGIFCPVKIFQKKMKLPLDIWGDPCYIEATRNPTPHRKEAANVRRSSQQKPMGSRERCKADHQDQPKPRPGAVRTLYQGARQPQRISKSTPPIWTYQPERGEIKKASASVTSGHRDHPGRCYQHRPGKLTQPRTTIVKEHLHYSLLDTQNQGGFYYDLRNQLQFQVQQLRGSF